MTGGLVRIRFDLLEAINDQAQNAYPGECCGLLAGRPVPDGTLTVTRVVASANTAEPPAPDRFEVDPQVRFDLMRALEGTDEEVIGHYHSHPDHPAKPSDTDLAMAFEPELVWLITAVINGTAGRTRAWRLDRDAKSVEALELEVVEKA